MNKRKTGFGKNNRTRNMIERIATRAIDGADGRVYDYYLNIGLYKLGRILAELE